MNYCKLHQLKLLVLFVGIFLIL